MNEPRKLYNGEVSYKDAKPNTAGKYRAHYYKLKVWIAEPVEEGIAQLEPDTIMRIRDYKGHTEEVFAKELIFSNN